MSLVSLAHYLTDRVAFRPPPMRMPLNPSLFDEYAYLETGIPTDPYVFTARVGIPSVGVIFYSGGNMDCSHSMVGGEDGGEIRRLARVTGCAVILWDYPGRYTPYDNKHVFPTAESSCWSRFFGGESTGGGGDSRVKMFHFGKVAYQYYQRKYSTYPIFLWGRSLGSSFPCWLTHSEPKRTWRGIVLESPLTSAIRTVVSYGMDEYIHQLDSFDNLWTIRKCKHISRDFGKVYIVCGDKDEVTLPESSMTLAEAIGPANCTLHLVPGKMHNNMTITDYCHRGRGGPTTQVYLYEWMREILISSERE